jgi:hypothetical protein
MWNPQVHGANGKPLTACSGYQRFVELLRDEIEPARRRLRAWDLLFHGKASPEGFDPVRDLDPRDLPLWHGLVTLPAWLAERGHADCLAALEAGESGPEGADDLVRQQAPWDAKHRAWQRVQRALDAGRRPDDADIRLMTIASPLRS